MGMGTGMGVILKNGYRYVYSSTCPEPPIAIATEGYSNCSGILGDKSFWDIRR